MHGIVRLPVRIDFIGGWSDQALFDGNGCVVNAAIGWDGKYPISVSEHSVESMVRGIGTGLGISSILAAGKYLRQFPFAVDYVEKTLEYENATNVRGGWQDPIGGIESGLKLITQIGDEYCVTQRDDHPLTSHVVLFDTGLRRSSAAIGHQVRSKLKGSVMFQKELEGICDMACEAFTSSNIRRIADLCLTSWGLLTSYFPDMEYPMPQLSECYGYKLVGAGGGGFGIYFVKRPELRQAVVDQLTEKGIWATVPEILSGISYE